MPLAAARDPNGVPVAADSARSAFASTSASCPVSTNACAKRRDHSTLVAAEGLICPPVSVRASRNHPQNLLESGFTLECLSQTALAQGDHALLRREPVDVIGTATLDDQPFDFFGDHQQFEKRLTTAIPGVRTSAAPDCTVNLGGRGGEIDLFGAPPCRSDVGLAWFVRLLAIRAKPASEALGESSGHRRRHKVGLESHLDETHR